MNQESKPHQPLPNVHQAEIDPRKFEQYSLNPNNPNNQGKWIAFMTIGYDVNSPQGRQIATVDIINQLRAKLANLPATEEEPSIYGLRFEVQVTLKGFNGQEGTLITKWQIDRGKNNTKIDQQLVENSPTKGAKSMKANIYDGILTLVDIYTDFGKRRIPKGTQGTIVECYENPEGYAIDLAIPDDRWVGGFDYENVILNRDKFEIVNTANILHITNT